MLNKVFKNMKCRSEYIFKLECSYDRGFSKRNKFEGFYSVKQWISSTLSPTDLLNAINSPSLTFFFS